MNTSNQVQSAKTPANTQDKPGSLQPDCSAAELLSRIQSYLGNGGLFNSEMMEHDKVRDLILACRQEVEMLTARLDECHKTQAMLIRNLIPKPPNK